MLSVVSCVLVKFVPIYKSHEYLSKHRCEVLCMSYKYLFATIVLLEIRPWAIGL
jgi:hypothetical protein